MPIRESRLIDERTGQVIAQKSGFFETFHPEKGYLFRNNAKYVKFYQEIPLSDVVRNKGDYANMHYLAEHLYKDTNMISVYRNKKHQPASEHDMQGIVKMCDRRFKEFLDRMVGAGVIAKVTVKTENTLTAQYYINPLYFNTSRYLPASLYMLFQKQLDSHLDGWVVRRFHEK
jgi:hypothetical protein